MAEIDDITGMRLSIYVLLSLFFSSIHLIQLTPLSHGEVTEHGEL